MKILVTLMATLLTTTALASSNDVPFPPFSLPPHPPAEAYEQPEPRIYKSWQGPIDLTKLEEALFDHTQHRFALRVNSMRWSRDPRDYAKYIEGASKDEKQKTKYSIAATYVVSLTFGRMHEAKCTVILWPDAGEGKVENCESETAQIEIYMPFKYEDIGLPFQRVTPTSNSQPESK